MITIQHAAGRVVAAVFVAALMQGAAASHAGEAAPACGPAQVIPVTGPEPPARLVVDAPLAGPLASRGVVVIPYCAENMRLAPVFGPGALTVSPRVGHVHVTVDEAPWHWADASGTPIILRGLPPGAHRVRIDLMDADHQRVDTGTVSFEVPARAGAPR
jgi:hypothetical protein